MNRLLTLLFFFCFNVSASAQDLVEENAQNSRSYSIYGSAVGGIYNGFTLNFELPFAQNKKGHSRVSLRTGVGGINEWGADKGRGNLYGASAGLSILIGGPNHYFDFSPNIFVGKTSRQSDDILGYPQIEMGYRYVHSSGITSRLHIGIPYVGVGLGYSF